MTDRAPKFTASDLIDRLRCRYADRAFAVLEQVPNATGMGCGSWIDAAVISLWPSNGLWRAAFEVKISRSDFLRELSKPNKNQWCRDRFHEFWYVAPADAIKEEELPQGVGWMKPRGDGLVVVRNASRRATVTTDDDFVAALARSIDSERNRVVNNAEKEVLAQSADHLEALEYKKACEAFVRERGGHAYGDSAKILEALREATTDKQSTEDYEHIDRVITEFRDNMLRVLAPFAQLCAYSILQRDATGEKLFRIWNSKPDENSVAALKKALKGKRKSKFRFSDSAEKPELIAALLEGLSIVPEQKEDRPAIVTA